MFSKLRIEKTSRSRLKQVDFDQLAFGNIFSDHMFAMSYENGSWGNPQILPYGPMPLEPGVATLHYGQSVFEGLKAFRGTDGVVRVFRADMNAKRLKASCIRLCIPTVDEDLFVEAIHRLVQLDHAWIPYKRGQSLYIRPIIFGVESHLDVRPSERFLFVVMTGPVRAYFENTAKGVALKVQEKFTRAAPGGTGFAKTAGNYAASLFPGAQSRKDGFDQALWLDGVEHRYVEEVGQMNIFFKIKGKVITPPLRGTILPGVTRDSVLTLLAEWGLPAEERMITIDEVVQAIREGAMEEAFGAGTAAVISPVGRIGYRDEIFEIKDSASGPLMQRLYREITGIQLGEIEDRHSWNTIVPVEESQVADAMAAK